MAYQVLARKWRPQKFDDVVGQTAVTRTLRNAIAGFWGGLSARLLLEAAELSESALELSALVA